MKEVGKSILMLGKPGVHFWEEPRQSIKCNVNKAKYPFQGGMDSFKFLVNSNNWHWDGACGSGTPSINLAQKWEMETIRLLAFGQKECSFC